MMLLAIILALLLMGAFGISLRAIPKEPKRHGHAAVVGSFGLQDLGDSDVGPNPWTPVKADVRSLFCRTLPPDKGWGTTRRRDGSTMNGLRKSLDGWKPAVYSLTILATLVMAAGAKWRP
jgi:hypothetical protein